MKKRFLLLALTLCMLLSLSGIANAAEPQNTDIVFMLTSQKNTGTNTKNLFPNYIEGGMNFTNNNKTFAFTFVNIGIDPVDYISVHCVAYGNNGVTLGRISDSQKKPLPRC